MRQPRQPVCRARRRPLARSGSAPGAGINARAAFCASCSPKRADFAGRRRRRPLRQRAAAARAERLAAVPAMSHPCAGESGRHVSTWSRCCWRWPADSSSAPFPSARCCAPILTKWSRPARSAAGGPAHHRARHPAGGADRHLRRAGDFLDGGRARAGRARCTTISASSRKTPCWLDTDLGMAGYTGDRVPAMQKRMIDALQAIPGVEQSDWSDGIPLGAGAADSMSSPTTPPICGPPMPPPMPNHLSHLARILPRRRYHAARRTGLHLARRQERAARRHREPRIRAQAVRLGRTTPWADYFKMPRWNPHPGGGHRRRRQIQQPDRRSRSRRCFCPSCNRPSSQTLLDRALQTRSAATGSRHPRQAARAGSRPARLSFRPRDAALDHRSVRPAHGDHVAGRAGPDGRNALDHRHLRHGCVFGQQAAEGTGHPHCAGRAAQRSAAGGVGTRLAACWRSVRRLDCFSACWPAGCWPSLCTRPRRAIRWCWPAWCWPWRCWACWPPGFRRSARLSIDPLTLLREE